ncbi:hypothetical protein PVAP13_1KG278910 [Panicum virgatum]|uniref:Uncharacterized protein n=1 Tax=Panicum virgatum TaxID=38727 RepID=A0A8T0XRR3_PANVG|nr:hypothetical protein PVAP13_1KG278910 [Panicum virgatum]
MAGGRQILHRSGYLRLPVVLHIICHSTFWSDYYGGDQEPLKQLRSVPAPPFVRSGWLSNETYLQNTTLSSALLQKERAPTLYKKGKKKEGSHLSSFYPETLTYYPVASYNFNLFIALQGDSPPPRKRKKAVNALK